MQSKRTEADEKAGHAVNPLPIMTVDDCATEAQTTRRTIERMIARGELTAYRFGPRLVRIRREDFDAAFNLTASAASAR